MLLAFAALILVVIAEKWQWIEFILKVGKVIAITVACIMVGAVSGAIAGWWVYFIAGWIIKTETGVIVLGVSIIGAISFFYLQKGSLVVLRIFAIALSLVVVVGIISAESVIKPNLALRCQILIDLLRKSQISKIKSIIILFF